VLGGGFFEAPCAAKMFLTRPSSCSRAAARKPAAPRLGAELDELRRKAKPKQKA